MHFGCDKSDDKSISEVLSHFPEDCRARRVENLGGAGGFSGAAFWRLTTERGLLCLRRWPRQADSQWPQRLGFIHAVLEHVARGGFSLVPLPIRTRRGESYLQQDGHCLELSAWLPGRADYFPLRRPEKLRGATTALAEFHRASADFVGLEPTPSPGIRRRRSQIDALRSGGLRAIATAIDATRQPSAGIDSDDWSTLVRLARRLLPFYAQAEQPVLRELIAAEQKKIPLQPCIRDIWHDHVLFEGDRVSGLVDFGAMRIDNVAGDVARLLGSFSESENVGDAGVWQMGLDAYEAIRPLSADERHLVGVFDRSTALLAGIHWLEWIFLEGREFAELAAVIHRLSGIVARLERLTRA